jgi:glycosyltransferase involved in cell wall biosynthesis
MCAMADEVWVLTRSNNCSAIEADSRSQTPGLHFIYYDLPAWALKLKKRAWFLSLYLILWQWGAYRVAAKLHRDKKFDAVYHVTFASMQSGSLMGCLRIPFIIGPVAGGERAPFRLRRSMPFRRQLYELFRDLGIIFQRISPLTRSAYAAADWIYVTTPDSMRLIPRMWRSKAEVQLAVGTEGVVDDVSARIYSDSPRFLYAGNLLHLKGVHFAIRALAQARKLIPEATFTIIGGGHDEAWLRTVAETCGITNSVEFAGRCTRSQLLASLSSYTALVFPSLHDSGGLIVLESLSVGLPVICLDIGGPGVMVNESCGFVIPIANANEDCVVTEICNAMVALGSMSPEELAILSNGAITRARELSWARLTSRITDVKGLRK